MTSVLIAGRVVRLEDVVAAVWSLTLDGWPLADVFTEEADTLITGALNDDQAVRDARCAISALHRDTAGWADLTRVRAAVGRCYASEVMAA